MILLRHRGQIFQGFFCSEHYLDPITSTVCLSFRPDAVIVSSGFGQNSVVSVGNSIMSGFQG